MSKYEVKGVKHHKGHEGEKLAQCNLYCDGKVVAEYSDGDWGGPAQFWWKDREAAKVDAVVWGQNDDGKEALVTIQVTPMEAALYARVKDMTWDGLAGMVIHTDPDIFVSDLLNAHNMKKMCKKKTLFRREGETYDDGNWDVANVIYSPETKAELVKQFGPFSEIYNEQLETA